MADQFEKSEILTVGDLVEKIENSPMTPKASTHELLYAFGWKKYITPKLSDPQLMNHSKYNSFVLTKENGLVKFRAKKLPQDPITNYMPRSGIRLIKDMDGIDSDSIGPADLRIERIDFDGIVKGLQRFLLNQTLELKMQVITNWDNLRKRLEDLPKKFDCLPKMKFSIFPKQDNSCATVSRNPILDEEIPALVGDLYPEEVALGSIEDEADIGMDVCLFTEEKKWRPWMGRIVKLLENNKMEVQWYKRKSKRSNVFVAVDKFDGSPYLNVVEKECVMFWMMSEPESRTENSFIVATNNLMTISREYEEVDSNRC